MEQTGTHKANTMTTNEKWVMASTAAGFSLENMDIMFLSFSLAPIIASLHISSAAAGWIGSITNLGMLAGGAVFGLVGDRIGRVKTFSYTIFIFAFATAAMFFAHSLPMIYLLRFLAGIGAGGEYGVGIALIAENFSTHQIGRMSSVAAIGGQVGAIFAALMAAWIIPSFGWNALFLLGIIPVVLTYFIRRHVHESASFLTAQKQAQQNHEKVAISRLYPTAIRSTANSMIMNVGRAIGGFSSVVIGILMDHYSLAVTMACLAGLYVVSFLVSQTLPGIRKLQH